MVNAILTHDEMCSSFCISLLSLGHFAWIYQRLSN